MSTRPSAREVILNKLREAVLAPKNESLRPPPVKKGDTVDTDALVEMFKTKAAAAAAVVKRTGTIPEAAGLVVSLMKEDGLNSAIVSGEEIIEKAGIETALRSSGIAVITRPPDPAAHKEACFTADAGITGASYGVAETGSLAMIFNAQNPRLISHAPFSHIALLSAGSIVPDTETLFARLAESRIRPSAMALVTGPSMTADIALTAVRGIHGPGKLYIIVIG